jgi:hypothetical protein
VRLSRSIAFENPLNQAITLQALTHTLPISITYRSGTSSGGAGDPAIPTIAGRQQLRWSLAQPIGAVSVATFKFGVAVNPSATIGTYTSTIAVHTSANVQDVTLLSTAALLIQQSTTVSNTCAVVGKVTPRPGLPPLINMTRGNSDEPLLVQTYLACPSGKTCNDPNADIFSVTFSPPRIDPPVNPQLTDHEGHYGWDVTNGCWFVVVSAPGYVTKISSAVGVPPAVTDHDMYLSPEGAYKVYLPLVRK